MSLITEIGSIEAFLQAKFPAAIIVKHTEPAEPAGSTFLLRLVSDTRKSETNLLVRTERTYQIMYWADDANSALETMDTLSAALYQTQLIPVTRASRFIRVVSFSFAQPALADNGLYVCTGTLLTEARQARSQESYEKIQHVYAQQITI
ncbi:hypothetical protein SK3146_03227 [Paenibacillus konkukensis]|uniref:LytTR family transcriptional regulator n=1 Tax=Paenibacillus konkukensis TaxID=2020716 RepID=A0ABY4RP86_9BACL|nr:hypothetical protein [Paenibacillus konkukensis]UQZ84015.1 hypothetical protein SK3146_03227 [Paenibacillus konkukensis]